MSLRRCASPGVVVIEAGVGDAERRESRIEEVGGRGPARRRLGGVELAAVEFDDEPLRSVDGVDFVAGDGLVSLGEWEVVALEEAAEVVFEGERVAPLASGDGGRWPTA
jgi:hypothetical protein